jgi:hypothetical protein
MADQRRETWNRPNGGRRSLPSTVHVRLSSLRREVQDGMIVSRRMDVDSGEERVEAVLNEINGRNLERSVGAWLGSQLKRRGWGRWRAAEALGVRLPKLSAWLDGSADPTERERERITSVFGPGLP